MSDMPNICGTSKHFKTLTINFWMRAVLWKYRTPEFDGFDAFDGRTPLYGFDSRTLKLNVLFSADYIAHYFVSMFLSDSAKS